MFFRRIEDLRIDNDLTQQDVADYLKIPKERHHILRSFNQWRAAIPGSFGYDPLECPDCKHKMVFLELYFNHQRVSLEEMYEKAMSKSRGKRSSA